MNITLRQLRYFEALARERHFGRAAARVAVSQPALSAQIRALEEALGGPLVDRARPGLPLTPLGRAVLEVAEAVIAELRALDQLARGGAGAGGPVALGMIPTVAPYLLPPLVPLLARDGVEVRLREAVTATLLGALAEGTLDAAVLALPLPAGEGGLVVEPLFEDRFLLATPPGAAPPVAAPAALRPEAIDPARLLLLEEEHCLAGQALAACGLGAGAARRRFGAASLATLARLVAAGEGVTLLPEMAAASHGAGLALHRFAPPEPGRRLALVAPGRRAPPWLAPLAALLREAHRAIPAPATEPAATPATTPAAGPAEGEAA